MSVAMALRATKGDESPKRAHDYPLYAMPDRVGKSHRPTRGFQQCRVESRLDLLCRRRSPGSTADDALISWVSSFPESPVRPRELGDSFDSTRETQSDRSR